MRKEYQLQYRSDGRWYPLGTFKNRQLAEEEAKTSLSCQNGWQVVPVKKK